MGCAVGAFILLYAIVTSLSGAFGDKTHLLSRALRLGVRIRACISMGSLATAFPPLIFISPDFWCGVLALRIVDRVARVLGNRTFLLGDHLGIGGHDFLPVFATTLLEGFILSFLLLMISFFAVALLQARERRNAFRELDPQHVKGI